MRPFSRRIQHKILFPVLGILTLMSAETLVFISGQFKDDLLRSAKDVALSRTAMIAATLWRTHEIDRPREIQSFVYGIRNYAPDVMVTNVVDSTFAIISSTDEDRLFELADSSVFSRAMENHHTVSLSTEGDSEPYVEVIYPISAPGEGNVAVGAVQVRVSLAKQFADLARFRRNLIIAGAAILIALSIVITLISRSITRPIQTLYAGMGEVNEGSLDVEVAITSRDEVGYLTSTFNDMIQRLRRLIESSRRFVPQPFLNALGKSDITDVAIGDATLRDMTVLFMDIRGFTPLSERMTADENLRFLNSLLERILPSIERNNGFVDKYMGDAMMALFADCPDDAVRAGIGLQEAVVAYNEERRAAGEPTVTVGVGINSGELILGTLGSGTRLDTTVIGSIVNVAARVEKLTKDFGVPLIVPAGVAEALRDDTRSQLSTRDLGAVQIRGVADEVRLVGVLVDGWTQEG